MKYDMLMLPRLSGGKTPKFIPLANKHSGQWGQAAEDIGMSSPQELEIMKEGQIQQDSGHSRKTIL